MSGWLLLLNTPNTPTVTEKCHDVPLDGKLISVTISEGKNYTRVSCYAIIGRDGMLCR